MYRMQILRKCQICNMKMARYSCKMCGAPVCEDDYDKESGLCIACKQGIK
jgi:hypothetical protein